MNDIVSGARARRTTNNTGIEMKIAEEHINISCPETEVYHRLLSLDGKHILELGCGSAQITRDIATAGPDRRVTAFEVDEIAHRKNLQITDLPNVTFGLAGAQDIPLDDDSVDVVFMFKSLHHVPLELMDQSMREIRRVLTPGGRVYISEPVFAGEFNEILRLFHDERKVREAAFNTVKKAVDEGLFNLVEETFFNSPMHFESFADFENRIIGATHTEHRLDDRLYQLVKSRFEAHVGEDGAHFLMPVRVDLLEK
jgi:SAM-dependent methyltransferase